MRACVCVRARACVRACVRPKIFSGFNVCIIVDLVKRGVLTLVGEIRRYRSDRYYCGHGSTGNVLWVQVNRERVVGTGRQGTCYGH